MFSRRYACVKNQAEKLRMMMQSAEADTRLKASDFTTPVNRRTRKRVQDFSPVTESGNRATRVKDDPGSPSPTLGLIPFDFQSAMNPDVMRIRGGAIVRPQMFSLK